MLFLVLGKGKTGSLVAQVARERGHSVRVLDSRRTTTPPPSPRPPGRHRRGHRLHHRRGRA
jgi:Trk K+ transport system NAD-binding subunit